VKYDKDDKNIIEINHIEDAFWSKWQNKIAKMTKKD
jgi:hypothetical protein